MPGRTGRPFTRPNQTSWPSVERNFESTRRLPVDEHHRPRQLVGLVPCGNPVAAPVPVGREHPRTHAEEPNSRRGRVDADRVRKHDRASALLELDPRAVDAFFDDLAEVVRPSHVYETRPFCSSRSRTSLRTRSPSPSSMSTVTVPLLRSTNEMTATSRAHSHTGEKTRSTLRSGDRAPLELDALRERERGGGRAEQGEDDQQLREPRHTQPRETRGCAPGRTAPRARSRSSCRGTPRSPGSPARSAGADSRAAPSRSGRTRRFSARAWR